MNVYIYMYIYIYIHARTCTHTYTQYLSLYIHIYAYLIIFMGAQSGSVLFFLLEECRIIDDVSLTYNAFVADCQLEEENT